MRLLSSGFRASFRRSLRIPQAPHQSRAWLHCLGWLCLASCLSNCQTVHFYVQAARGTADIQSRRRPVTEVIKDPQTPEKVRGKLVLAQNLCSFAGEELKLPAKGQYSEYADLGRKYAVWNVFAARELSLQEKTWWYPVLGNLAYRGFFKEQEAKDLAAHLRAEGDDVFVGGIEVFSTLGWLHDPLLNTFIHHSEPILAENLFHELGHQRLFVSGDTDFNEAYATAVGQNGARLWLKHDGKTSLLSRYELHLKRLMQVVRLFHETRDKLATLYGDEKQPNGRFKAATQPRAMPVEEMRRQKAAILEQTRREYESLAVTWGVNSKMRITEDAINNARLNSMATYYDLVPAFERLLAMQKGDWNAFYKEVEKLGKLSKTERRKTLERIAAQPKVDPAPAVATIPQ